MGIYEDWQIHTKTSFRPIKLQESWSDPHTNRTPYNKHKFWKGKTIETAMKKLESVNSSCEQNSIFG